jgi:site-specific DNA recombinase
LKEQVVAIYCRLSKEDIDKDTQKTYSESIKNQKSMLESHALEQGWRIFDFYIDEDYSGSDRERPEFNRLITDSFMGHFNIVLCKNQARFARDIEYVEKYIHGLFTERQIRFVALLDHIDTGSGSRYTRRTSQLNSLMDEWYLADLSDNIQSALNEKRRKAEFIGSWAPYGYQKDPENKNALIIDPEAAAVVKKIYSLYQKGLGISRIAQKLNEECILNPLTYKRAKGEKINPNPKARTNKSRLWSPSTISSILHNQTYTGCLVQGKYKKASYKSKKLLRLPPSDWIIIPNCHEAIIPTSQWEEVQRHLKSKSRATKGKRKPHALSGLVFCGECGSKLVSSGGVSGKKKTTYLCCSKNKLSKDACKGARIQYEKLESYVLKEISSIPETNSFKESNSNIDSRVCPNISSNSYINENMTTRPRNAETNENSPSLTGEMVNQLISSIYIFKRVKGTPQKIQINLKSSSNSSCP